MQRRKWFNGVRLSTLEQERLVHEILTTGTQWISTGDTAVEYANGFISVYRLDFEHQLSKKESARLEQEES